MVPGTNLEWLNRNAQRAYPLRSDCTRTDATGILTIPDHLILDLVMVVPVTDSATYHLRSLMFSGQTLTMELADSDSVTVGTVTINTTTHVTGSAYTILGQGDYSGSMGRVVFGRTDNLADWLAPGLYVFDAGATIFEARTVRPDLRALNSLRIVAADGSLSEPITGPIELIAGGNTRLTYIAPDGDTPARIKVDAVDDPNYDEGCDCDDEVAPLPPIRTINNVGPDDQGNIGLVQGACTVITSEGNKVVFGDTCTKPCCGCTELEFITERLTQLDAAEKQLEAIVAQLSSRSQEFYQNVLATLRQ